MGTERNTFNVINIELIAIDYLDPEVLLIRKQCGVRTSKRNNGLVRELKSYNILDKVDISVLIGEITRKEASEILSVSYDTYQKRLYRKVNKIRELMSDKVDSLPI